MGEYQVQMAKVRAATLSGRSRHPASQFDQLSAEEDRKPDMSCL